MTATSTTCRCGGACRAYSASDVVAILDRRSPIALADPLASSGLPPAGVDAEGSRAGRASPIVSGHRAGTPGAAERPEQAACPEVASPASPVPTSNH